jgi:uncharacterized protein (DUF736 family)
MRKTIIEPETINPRQNAQDEWLDLEKVATVQITSEDPKFLIESALATREGPGWRAAERGRQVIRLVLDIPRALRRIRLEFSETENSRTQEFTLRWSRAGGPMTEIVRQQWSFSPQASGRGYSLSGSTDSLGPLSSRRPKKTGWRNFWSAVHS